MGEGRVVRRANVFRLWGGLHFFGEVGGREVENPHTARPFLSFSARAAATAHSKPHSRLNYPRPPHTHPRYSVRTPSCTGTHQQEQHHTRPPRPFSFLFSCSLAARRFFNMF